MICQLATYGQSKWTTAQVSLARGGGAQVHILLCEHKPRVANLVSRKCRWRRWVGRWVGRRRAWRGCKLQRHGRHGTALTGLECARVIPSSGVLLSFRPISHSTKHSVKDSQMQRDGYQSDESLERGEGGGRGAGSRLVQASNRQPRGPPEQQRAANAVRFQKAPPGRPPNSVEDFPKKYYESTCFQCCTRACGRCWWMTLIFCVLAWVVHSMAWAEADPCEETIQWNNGDDPCSPDVRTARQAHWDLAPAYSKTLLWMSLAHHTEPWDEHWNRGTSPPPPGRFQR